MRNSLIAALALLAPTPPALAQSPTIHQLPATPATVAYGYYWAQATPALRIKSGDIVELETMLTNTPAGLERLGVKPSDVPPQLRAIVAQDTGSLRGPGGHILTGPIYVEGAEPGDVLEVRIQSVTLPIAYAYNGCSGFIRELCEPRSSSSSSSSSSSGSTLIQLDRKAMTAEVAPGIVVPLRPFFGSMGVAPAPALGRVSSTPPGRHAGNLDNRELVAGSTLYIPVFAKGALLEIGDGHAAQGDGEVDQTAIETNLRGRVQLIVRKDMKLEWPRAETPTQWITMGTDTSLTAATRIAVREMVKFLQERKGITQIQAYQAASMAADLRITQLVDGNVGVHMMIAKRYLRPRGTSSRPPAPQPRGTSASLQHGDRYFPMLKAVLNMGNVPAPYERLAVTGFREVRPLREAAGRLSSIHAGGSTAVAGNRSGWRAAVAAVPG